MVVGQLEPVAVAREAHEDVDRLLANRHPPALFEAERLVEGDGPVDLPDPVAGVDELHDAAESTVMDMIVERSMTDNWLSNTYLVAAGPNSDAFLVDAGGPLQPLFDKADEHGLNVTHILLTHHHHDHVAELGDALAKYPEAQVLAHPTERVPGTTGDLNPGDEVDDRRADRNGSSHAGPHGGHARPAGRAKRW